MEKMDIFLLLLITAVVIRSETQEYDYLKMGDIPRQQFVKHIHGKKSTFVVGDRVQILDGRNKGNHAVIIDIVFTDEDGIIARYRLDEGQGAEGSRTGGKSIDMMEHI